MNLTYQRENPKPRARIHLRYIRLPDRVSDFHDELIYKSNKVIVGRQKIRSPHSMIFDHRTVLRRGFEITYFGYVGNWYTVGKIRSREGKHTGYYCDIVTPAKPLPDGGFELTDLFLDLWVSPDLRYRILDEEELKEALAKEWITKALYERARRELMGLVNTVRMGRFPPLYVKRLERKLGI